MELRINKNGFLKSLGWTQGVVERRSTMPILANCLLEAKTKGVAITATDLEVGVVVEEAAEVTTPGKVTVAAKGLFDIVRELPEDRATIKVLANHWVEITSGKARFKIAGMSAEEFPNLPVTEKGEMYTADAPGVSEMIRKVSYAISTDETRFNLNGVFAEVIDGDPVSLRFVATDSHRLSYAQHPVQGKWKLGKGVIIPRKGIMELRRLLDGVEGNFGLQFSPKHITVQRENVTLMIRLIDGQFPPYQQVIPKDHQRIVAVERAALIHALRRAQIVTTDRSRGVALAFSSGNLRMTVNNPDMGEVEEELPATYKGETFKWAVNGRYLADVLGTIQDEQAILELKGEVSPCIIRSEYDKGFLAVVMPMRI